METTKQRINLNAQKLFSEFGIPNTRLQQIADKSGISIGNLAYHYKNKEEIVTEVYLGKLEELSGILIMSKIDPSLASFDTKFTNLYHFMVNNIFYFTNFWEIKRNYFLINKKIQYINNRILFKLKKRIKLNFERGIIKPEEFKDAHTFLAKTILLSLNSWLPQQLLNGDPVNESLFRMYLWNLIYPHLTLKGKKEFNSLK